MTDGQRALDENEIIDAVCGHLSQLGYSVRQRLHTTEHGVDIIPNHPSSARTIYVEAKGGAFGGAALRPEVYFRGLQARLGR